MSKIEGKFDTSRGKYRERSATGNRNCTGRRYDALVAVCRDRELDHAVVNGVFYVNKDEADAYLESLGLGEATQCLPKDADDCDRADVTKLFASFLEFVTKNREVLR